MTSRLAPGSAGAKTVIGLPPSCGVNVTAYCVMFLGISPANSGGGSSGQFSVIDLPSISPMDGAGISD